MFAKRVVASTSLSRRPLQRPKSSCFNKLTKASFGLLQTFVSASSLSVVEYTVSCNILVFINAGSRWISDGCKKLLSAERDGGRATLPQNHTHQTRREDPLLSIPKVLLRQRDLVHKTSGETDGVKIVCISQTSLPIAHTIALCLLTLTLYIFSMNKLTYHRMPSLSGEAYAVHTSKLQLLGRLETAWSFVTICIWGRER